MLRFKQFILLLGDIILLYGSLMLALFIRRPQIFAAEFGRHLLPFTILFVVWLTIFFIAGLYDLHRMKNNLAFAKTLAQTLLVSFAIAALLFYLIPFFGITPKTILFLFFIIFGILSYAWRYKYNQILRKRGYKETLLFIKASPTAEILIDHLSVNPQLGYIVTALSGKRPIAEDLLAHLSGSKPPDVVVLPAHLPAQDKINKILYSYLVTPLYITTGPKLYEGVFKKVLLEELNESWFIQNLSRHRIYDRVKHALEPVAAFILLLILSPLFLLIALLIKTTSPGQVIYKQKRVGKSGSILTLYKFRTMRQDAEKGKAQWAQENDSRVIRLGKFLRYTHLDELPQLVNILKGNILFIGPRPERPEFISELQKEIPFYDIRHIIKPGITGWAQINYRYGASVEDAKKKLEYDIFYLKNRSLILDLVILLKTLRLIFVKIT